MEIKRGDILHSWNVHGIDHGKFFVVLNVTKDSLVGFFFINSIVNRFIEDKPELFELQYPIRPCDYEFLSHNSFICGSALIEVPVTQIQEQLNAKVAEIVGSIRDTDMANLMNLCRKSRLYSIKQKKNYFY